MYSDMSKRMQLHAHAVGELARDLGLADAGGSGEQEVADRLVRIAQAGARHADRRDERVDRLVLAEHDVLQVAVERLQRVAIVRRHAARRNARDLGDDLLDLGLADDLLLARLGQDLLRGAGLVDDVDRLVRQVAVVDEARRQLGRGGQRRRRVLHAVVLLEARLESLQDLDRLGDRGLGHVDLLEAPRQRVVLLEDAAVLGVRRGADALERAGRQRRLEQVGCVERAARCRAGADDGVDLVDEQHRLGILGELLQHRLQALLEIAAVLGAGEQCAHVERVDRELAEQLGDLALDDAAREAFGDRGLADAGLADQQRVVLAPTAKHLDDALELVLAADQRIDLARLRQVVQVEGVGVERAGGLLLVAVFLGRFGLLRLLLLLLGDAVRDVVDNIEAGHAALVEEIDRVRFLLAEDGDQHVGAGDFLLAGGLDVQDGALDDALESLRGLRVGVGVRRQAGRVLVDEVGEHAAQLVEVDAAGLEDFGGRRIVEHREQQVLDGDELMLLLPRLDKSHVEGNFEFLRNHGPSRLRTRRHRHHGAPAA